MPQIMRTQMICFCNLDFKNWTICTKPKWAHCTCLSNYSLFPLNHSFGITTRIVTCTHIIRAMLETYTHHTLEHKEQLQAFYVTHLPIGQAFHKKLEAVIASVFFSAATRSYFTVLIINVAFKI